MLAGLLFATTDADDRPDTLVATLAFGGHSLIEFQARLLASAGVGHIIVVVERLTPELLGAINRMGRHNIAVDAVRSAAEAVGKLHPLAQVLVLADGLVTSADLIAHMAEGGGDALLVTPDAEALPGLERVGRDAIWAGMARVSLKRLADVARLPADYDFQSTLLRVTAQAQPELLYLPPGAARQSHGIEAHAERLQARNQAVVAADLAQARDWAGRYLSAPAARALLPLVLARQLASGTLAALGALVALAGLGLIAIGWQAAGLVLVAIAESGWRLGQALGWLRDERRLAQAQRLAGLAAIGASVALIGVLLGRAEGSASGPIAAAALLLLAGLHERAAGPARPRWAPGVAAYPWLLLPFIALGQPLAGLIAAALYAGGALAHAIEALREKA